jgi:hypothetical protein
MYISPNFGTCSLAGHREKLSSGSSEIPHPSMLHHVAQRLRNVRPISATSAALPKFQSELRQRVG